VLTVRYTTWDGTQRTHLSPRRSFERLAELLGVTENVEQALEWLLRKGAELDGVEVQGLDALLEQVRDALRAHFRDVDLRSAFAELWRRLEEALSRERAAIERLPAGDERAARHRALADLPTRLSEALEALGGAALLDAEARRIVDELLERLDDLRDLEEFSRRYGERFHGAESVSFDEAVELMREMERWRALEEALARGDLDGLDPGELEALLGAGAVRSVQLLRQMLQTLWQGGYLAQREGRVQLSPKGIRRIGQLALRDIYQGLLRDRAGGHETDYRGLAEIRPDQTKRYVHGEPLALDLVGTLKKAVSRGGGLPLELRPEDFEVHACDHTTTSATILLLDMSWSMSWEGRFAAAKRVALALEALIRARFPKDFFAVVGFYTRAVEIRVRDLPSASWNMGDPFTNLQDGLRMASRLLARHPSRNRHVIVITDGQPTAYFAGGRLHCEWPLSFGGISVRAAQETLREVERVTRQGIVINTFMLDDSPSLRAFVERMTRINKGRALYTRPDRLGEYLLVDYLTKKRKRV